MNVKGEQLILKRLVLMAAFIMALASLPPARADRGAIIAEQDVDLQEPAQRALIAHNGVEELLILQTDVQASRAAKIVEFMPLPSQPAVSLAAEGCFKALQETIDRHGLRYFIRTRGAAVQVAEKSAVKLVVAEQLGPHHVSVVEVSDVNDFLKWVEQFFQDNDLGKPNVNENLRQVVGTCLKEGLRFFAFDVIAVADARQTVQPLAYRFRSEEIYYPLRVTNLYGGSGSIELLVIAPEDVLPTYWRLGLSPASGQAVVNGAITYKLWRTEMAKLTETELGQIEPSMAALLKKETPVLGAVKYEGPLVFGEDVRCPLGYGSPEMLAKRFLRALDEGDAARLDTLVAVPFAMNRKSVIEGKDQLTQRLAELARRPRGSGVSSHGLEAISIGDYPLSDPFDKAFAQKYLRSVDYAIVAASQTDEIRLYARQGRYGMYRIVGFNDPKQVNVDSRQ